MELNNADLRVLIVDDTLKNIQVLGTILRQEGYQINVAQDGKQALDVVEKVNPDIILLDIMMPEMDGFEACTHLKKNPSTRHIPIIFLTAKVETEDIVKGFELGAVDYVTKPFNPTELLSRVYTHLSVHLLQNALRHSLGEISRMKQEQEAFLKQALKSRITPILDYAQRLSRSPNLDVEEQKWASIIHTGTAQMSDLIDSTEELQDLETGHLELNRAELQIDQLIEQVAMELEFAYGKKIRIPCENGLLDGTIEADEDLLKGVFQNLIKNGVEHILDPSREAERQVRVNMYGESGQVVVEIHNGGEAIPPDQLETFFQKFNSRKEEGAGLGTSYAYAVAKAHGGDINVASNPETGTTLTVRLPLAAV